MFWFSNLNALFDSVICSYFPIYQLHNFGTIGVFETFFQAGALTYTAVIFVANARVALLQDQWYSLNILIIVISIAAWFAIGMGVSNVLSVDYNWYKLFDRLINENSFWASLFCVLVIIFIKDLVVNHVRNVFWPSDAQIMIEERIHGDPYNIVPTNKPALDIAANDATIEMIDIENLTVL